MTKAIIKIDNTLLERIQNTIKECLPVVGKSEQTISDSVVIANGLNQMRDFFQNKDVKLLVESMSDSKLGFLTDKPKGKKKWNAQKQTMVDIVPYSYHEISEAIIPMILEGYRFTGNEINIISGQGMPVKAGKHRKIIEYEGLEGFIHTVGSPVKYPDEKSAEKGIAKMKCQAKWIIEGLEYTIGYGDDACIIAVEYDKWSGLDKLVGLAESKLYSRVLTRILGKFVSEGEISTVITPTEKTDPEKQDIKDRFKKQQAQDQKSDPQEKTPSQRLKEMVNGGEYKIAIDSLVSSGEYGLGDFLTENDGNAELVIESIEKVQGFQSAEQSNNVDDHF